MTQSSGAAEGELLDVIVIGAGLSGLSAAYHLTKTVPGCKVLVLEAKDRVGGRTLTVPLKAASGTDDWDLGGQWVCRTQHHVLWLIEELGIETYPQYCKGTKLMQSDNRSKVKSYEGDNLALPLHVLLDIFNLERKADKLARHFQSDTPWTTPCADYYDSITFEQYLAQETWTKGARDMVEAGYDLVNGSRGRGHSALNYLSYLRSGISSRSLYDNKDGGAQETKIKGGAQPLSKELAEKIGQSNVLLSEAVVSIDQSAESGEVKVQTSSGKSFSCKYVINSMPTNLVASIQYLPDPPTRRNALTGHMRIGNLFKFTATYKTAFWREKGYSGEAINICDALPDSRNYVGPVTLIMDATTGNGNPALVGFLNHAHHWGDVEAEETKEVILNHMAEFLGPEAKAPLDFIVKDWSREPYNGGCPVNMMMCGAAQYWDTLREPFQRIHWAGTETATHWNGYLSGAVQSGLRAADEVTARLVTSKRPAGTKSDLLRSLDELGDRDRGPAIVSSWKGGPGGSFWWVMGKASLCLAVLGVVASMSWMHFQGN